MNMANKAYIAVDLDGTLAHYEEWNGGEIGKPIPLMVNRVKKWIKDGNTVKIFTARANTGDKSQIEAIKKWCKINIGTELEVTATKDFNMVLLYDDRAIQVETNTGKLVEQKTWVSMVK